MIRTHLRVFALCCFAAVATSPARAADITGTVVGTVTDPTGAKVQGAKIDIFSVERSRSERALVSDADGNFTAALLPIGKYRLSVEANGFKKVSITDVTLNVNDKLTFPVKLDVGDLTQSITVQDSTVAVQLQAAEQSTTINSTQIESLTLNNRNYEQLVSLMPGVTASTSDQIYVGVSNPATGGQSNQINFSINGSRPTQNSWTVDGIDNLDRGANLTLLNYPSVDALQEFKVLRSNYSAEFGRSAGGQINVVTKSGTRDFHGDAYEFFRNDAITANTVLNNTNGIKNPPLRYNNFGWTLGGPIFIPKVYNKERNKTFFFASEEFRRVITYTSTQATVPTASMLGGTFARPVCLTYTGTLCQQTGTRVTNISPLAQAYIKDIYGRIPTAGQGSFLIATPIRNVYNFEQELYKLDHVFGPKLTVSVRFLRDQIPTTEPGGLFTGSALPNVATTNTNSPGRSWVGRATSTISPKVVNEAGFGYSYGAVLSQPSGLISKQNSPDIVPNLPFASTLNRIPTITLNGGSSITSFGQYVDVNRNYNGYDNLSLVFGPHNVKTGFSYNYYQKTENAGGNNAGTFAFNAPAGVIPAGTTAFEQSWADFLTGRVATFSQASLDLTPDIRAQQWELYVNDDYRVASNFTVNLGLRYSMFRNPIDANNQASTFNPAAWNPARAPRLTATGNIIPGTGDPLNGITLAGKNSPYADKVSGQPTLDFAPRIGIAWDPFKTGKTSIRAGYGIFYDATSYSAFETNIFTNPPYVSSISIPNTLFDNPLAGTPSVSSIPVALRAVTPNYVLPYTQQWNFSIQRQFADSILADISYVGTKGTHLLGVVDINQVYPGLAYSSGVIANGTPITSANTPRLNVLRPYTGYNAINMTIPTFNSHYHSLQAYVKKQFRGSSLLSASYTWSKNLTNAGGDTVAAQNSTNYAAEEGRAPQDRRHVFSANFVYELPFFRANKGIVRTVLGGWDISGIVQVNSGLPSTVTISPASVDPAGLGFIGSSAAGARPDLSCVDPNAGAPHTIAAWFDKSCFATVPTGVVRPGNAGRGIINGPGYQRWDLSAFKNFTFHDRYTFQLRGDAFNVWNHVNLLGINTSFTSPTFGTVTSYRDPRILQIAAKFRF